MSGQEEPIPIQASREARGTSEVNDDSLQDGLCLGEFFASSRVIPRFGPTTNRLLWRGGRRLRRFPRYLPLEKRRSTLCLLFRLRPCLHAQRQVAKRRAHHGRALLG